VTVITSKVSPNEQSGLDGDVHVIRIGALNPLEKHGVPQPIFSPRLLWEAARAVRHADIVHAHDVFYMSSLATGLAAWLLRKPFILTQHIMYVQHKIGLVNVAQKIAYATSGRFLFNKSSTIFTLNDDVTTFLRSRHVPEHKIQRMPNGVDPQLFFPPTASQKVAARKKFGLPTSGRVVLFVGRFVAKKGFDKVIAAHSADYHLALAGGETDEKLPKGVTALGKLPQSELAELYRTADLFVLPSTGEGFPLSVQEAMATGIPVITTDDPGYASYNLDKSLVRMLPKPTKASVRAAIAELLEDPALRKKMSAYSTQYAMDHFTWDRVVAELEQTYQATDKKEKP
jgi:glycosyltransferase involved in cell wall biosynthesis